MWKTFREWLDDRLFDLEPLWEMKRSGWATLIIGMVIVAGIPVTLLIRYVF